MGLIQPSQSSVNAAADSRKSKRDEQVSKEQARLTKWCDKQFIKKVNALEKQWNERSAKVFKRMGTEITLMRKSWLHSLSQYRVMIASKIADPNISAPMQMLDSFKPPELEVEMGSNGFMFTVDAIKGQGLLPVQIEAIWCASNIKAQVRVTISSCPGRFQDNIDKKKHWRQVGHGSFTDAKQMTRIELDKPVVVGPGYTASIYIHTNNSYGVGASLSSNDKITVQDDHIQLLQGVALYSKTPFEHVDRKHKKELLDKQRDEQQQQKDKQNKPTSPKKEVPKKPKGALSNGEPMNVAFVGRVEYTLQSMAWATM